MISPWKLIRIARKWQKAAALRRKRISLPGSSEVPCLAERGNFVVYTMDQKRFEFPMKYLSNSIIRELLRLSEEEFGLPRDGPIKLPCDATFLAGIISLIQQKDRRDMPDYDPIVPFAASRCSLSTTNHERQQLLLCS